ncbi:DUF5076 domain-containing protein [Mesorhizobium sp.]|uniref:DUF5076 domain-containing protein n=1 Tax=Mesorhizobium sp. TaxID=1871066 RepID=UPI0012242903|nr:DUF5076 domain-containing protein [Mesorhizobium sp.]TIM45601.1 MAG: DUF5076 domain-containing protein [Mesorhizobium sp.]
MSRELEVPAVVVENSEFDEILRVWIGSGAVVTMQDLFGPNAHNWGMVLADVGMHIARMRLEQDGILKSRRFRHWKKAIEAECRSSSISSTVR